MLDLHDYLNALVPVVEAAIAAGFLWLGYNAFNRISWRMGRALLAWPCIGLGWVALLSALIRLYWNFLAPIITEVVSATVCSWDFLSPIITGVIGQSCG